MWFDLETLKLYIQPQLLSALLRDLGKTRKIHKGFIQEQALRDWLEQQELTVKDLLILPEECSG